MMRMSVRPHIERGGYHVDLFEASIDDWLVLVSRQPLYDGALALLACGYDPETLVTVRYGCGDQDGFKPRSSASSPMDVEQSEPQNCGARVEAVRYLALSDVAARAGDDQSTAD